MATEDVVGVLLKLKLEAEGQQELNNFGNAFRNLVKNANSLELGLRKLARIEAEFDDVSAQFGVSLKNNFDDTEKLRGRLAKLSQQLSDQQLRVDSLSKSYQTQFTNSLKSAQTQAAQITAQEIKSAEAFRQTVPAIQAEIAAIDAFNKKVSSIGVNLSNFDLIRAKAFGRDEAPQTLREVQALDAFNASISKVENNLANYDLIRAKAFGINEAPQIRNDIAAINRQNAETAAAQAKIDKRGPLGKLFGLDLHTSIYQLSAFYYLLSNVTQQLKAATEKSLEYALAVETLSEQTGISTQTSSAFTLASEQLGIKVDTVQEAFRTFSDRLGRSTGLFGEPTKGSKDMARAMKELGINVFDANGEVRSLESLMPQIFDAFQKLGPGIKSTAIATALFGQRADEMIPLLVRGSANITEMAKRAQALGLVLTPERTDNLRNLTKAFNDVALAGQSMFQTILDGLGPFSDEISAAAFDMATAFRTTFLNISAEAVRFKAEEEARTKQFESVGFLPLLQQGPGAGQSAAETFAKSQGFIANPDIKPNDPLGFLKPAFIPDPNLPAFQTGTTSGKPGEDDAEKITEKLIGLNKKIGDLNRDFALKQFLDIGAFRAKQRQEQAEFDAKQLQAVEDFKTKEAKTIADFNLKQLRDFEDYQIDRDRLLEDFNAKQTSEAEDLAQKRIDLEEATRKKLQEVNDKWDEILLRLRIGGDVDSIRLAEQKRLEALDKARQEETGAGSDLAKAEEDARKRQEIEQADLDLRLKRLDEDFALRDQRRKDDFEAELAERKATFEAEQQQRLDDFKKKHDDDKVKFDKEAADRKAELDRKVADVVAEINALLGITEPTWQTEQDMLRARNNTRKGIAADGKDDRTQVVKDEQNALAYFIGIGTPPIVDAEQALQDGITNAVINGSNTRMAVIQSEQEQLLAFMSLQNEVIAGGEKYNDSHSKTDTSGTSATRRAFGGTVPGALGSPQLVLAHGGERYTPPATSSYFNSVRSGDQISINAPITFSNNVNSDAIASRISNRASRELGRRIAARRAFGG